METFTKAKGEVRGPGLERKAIQTTHLDYDAERIWALYMTLTRVEAAFRALKSDLGLRPVRIQ